MAVQGTSEIVFGTHKGTFWDHSGRIPRVVGEGGGEAHGGAGGGGGPAGSLTTPFLGIKSAFGCTSHTLCDITLPSLGPDRPRHAKYRLLYVTL